jgi:hypothetical protein
MVRNTEAGYRNPGLLCGHIDGIARFGRDHPAIDRKIHRFWLSAIGLLLTAECRQLASEFIREMFNRRQHWIWGAPP